MGMFGNGAEQSNQRQDGPPQLPPMRNFVVRRPNRNLRAGSPLNESAIEEIRLAAHAVQFNDRGNILQFVQVVKMPDGALNPMIRRCFYFEPGMDYEEELVCQSQFLN